MIYTVFKNEETKNMTTELDGNALDLVMANNFATRHLIEQLKDELSNEEIYSLLHLPLEELK